MHHEESVMECSHPHRHPPCGHQPALASTGGHSSPGTRLWHHHIPLNVAPAALSTHCSGIEFTPVGATPPEPCGPDVGVGEVGATREVGGTNCCSSSRGHNWFSSPHSCMTHADYLIPLLA